jgi:YbgC/YbaW family acyl-CoA thioester hydrolase
MEEKECPKHYVTVRYNECDPTGFAFNANFFIWIQESVVPYWKGLGVDVVAMSMAKQTFMAVHLSCDYKRPVAFGDVIEIRPKVTRVTDSSIQIQYDVYNRGKLSAVGRSIYVFMDTRTKNKLPLTDELREKFESGC